MLISSVSYLSLGSEGVDPIFNPLYISGFLRSCLFLQSVIFIWVLKGLLVSSNSYMSLGSKGMLVSSILYMIMGSTGGAHIFS